MKFNIIVADPPYSFSDKLTMTDVPRGAQANYDVLNMKAIKELEVESIAADDALLALWVPSSMLQDGLDIMKLWGFEQKQTFVWAKTVKEPLSKWIKKELASLKDLNKQGVKKSSPADWLKLISRLGISASILNDYVLAFGMGRTFRQTHEICLIGTRGKIYTKLKDKSQRSVLFDVNLKHSAKPEGLQDRLELMFPDTKKLEMFARRKRYSWSCVGNECPDSIGEDIRDSIKRLKKKR